MDDDRANTASPILGDKSFAQLADFGVSFRSCRIRNAWKHLKHRFTLLANQRRISSESVCEFGCLRRADMADSLQYGFESLRRLQSCLLRSLQ